MNYIGSIAPYNLKASFHVFFTLVQSTSTSNVMQQVAIFPVYSAPQGWFSRSSAPEPSADPQPETGPQAVPAPEKPKPKLPNWMAALLLLCGVIAGYSTYQMLQSSGASQSGAAKSTTLQTVTVERADFQRKVRIGGTSGATNFAMIRAPRMRGGRDRGGGGGGSSLTIETLAEPGSIVQAGDVVAQFESKRTSDTLETFASALAQTKAQVAARKANMIIATETLRQNFVNALSEAKKAKFDLQTAEVKSAIQAEILALLAADSDSSSIQLEEEYRLQQIANIAESRSLEISIEQDKKRKDRTEADFGKMVIRSPVSGLVVVETIFQRGTFAQTSPGDQVHSGSYFMRVVDLSNMAVFASLNQVDSQSIQIGSKVNIQLDAYPDVVFEGRVSSVGAMAVSGSSGGGRRGPPGSTGSRDQWVKQIPVQVEILSTDDRIMPDLSASADIIIEQLDDVLVIPRAAVKMSSERYLVWVMQDNRLVEREVALGPISDTEAVVISGLNEGEQIAALAEINTTMIAQR